MIRYDKRINSVPKVRDFLDAKEKALSLLEDAKTKNQIDEKIRPIVDIINRSDDYYTSSSCAGRIVLIELPQIGDKIRAKFLGKWHRKIELREINTAAKKADTGLIWLLAQSPILHIGVDTRKAADNLLKTAISCGFKNSGAKSIGRKIIIEICSTERLDAPLGKDGRFYCSEEHLNILVNIANEMIDRSNLKLNKFGKKLERFIDTCKPTQQ